MGKLFRSRSLNNIGSVLILVVFGIMAFCAVSAVVIDISRVYLESARVEEAVEASTMAASREMAKYRSGVTALNSTQENEVKNAAISFAAKNGVTLSATDVVVAGNRIYVDGGKRIEYTFAKIIGFDSNEVIARKAAEVDASGNVKIVNQAQYNVMPIGIPHRELNEPYDISTQIITMEPSSAYEQVTAFTPGKEYVLKLGSGVASGDAAVPPGTQVLIPMGTEGGVNDQWSTGYKRAYGLVLWLLTPTTRNGAGISNVKWLLNYRGGSFMFQYDPAVMTRLGALKLAGSGLYGSEGVFMNPFDPVTGVALFPWVKYTIVTDPTSIFSQASAIINLTTAPRIGVYSSGIDAVTRTLYDAGIPYDIFYDTEVLSGILTTPLTNPEVPYTWLHLHHEDFYSRSTSQTEVPLISIWDTTGNDKTGPHSQMLYIRGSQWPSYSSSQENVRLYFGDKMMTPTLTGTYTGCSVGTDTIGPYVRANDSGRFEVTVTIPPKPNGIYQVYGRIGGTEGGDESSNYDQYTITGSAIIPAITAVNNVTGNHDVSTGNLIKVTGSSFGAYQPNIYVMFDGVGQPVTTTSTFPGSTVSFALVTADSNGNFEVTFPTPDVTDGTHEVYAQVDMNKSNTVSFNVNNFRTPVISISDYIGIGDRGPKGSILYVNGSGFVPNYTGIGIKFAGTYMNILDTNYYTDDYVFGNVVTSDGEGKFQVKFTVSETAADGTYEVVATEGALTTAPQTYTVSQLQTAEIAVWDMVGAPQSGPPGAELVCNGVNFTPAQSNIAIKFGTTEMVLIDTPTYPLDAVALPDNNRVTADLNGKFEVKFVIPVGTANGTYPVQAFVGGVPLSNVYTYTVTTFSPNITLLDSAAPYNEGLSTEWVTVTGSGFSPNAQNLLLYFNNQIMNLQLPAEYSGAASITDNTNITADSSGAFQVKFQAPIMTPGSYLLRVANATEHSPTLTYNLQPISTFYTSAASDFSTTSDAFSRTGTMYLKMYSTEIDKNNVTNAYFTVSCGYHTGAAQHVSGQINLTNNGDYTYTGSFNWASYANVHNGTWQIQFYLRDSSGNIYNPTKVINVTGTNVATQSSILSINSNLSTSNFGFYNRQNSIYYKTQSNVVEPSFITEKSAIFMCSPCYTGESWSHVYYLPDMTNNLDGTFSGSYNLDNISPDCHYGKWYLRTKVTDSLSQDYTNYRDCFLFSSNSSLRAIVSDNSHYYETYDIKSDGNRSDTSAATPYPIFNLNGMVYIVFNAAPPTAVTKVNYSSVSVSEYWFDFSEYSGFTTGNYSTGSSVAVEKRGKAKTSSSAHMPLANNSNGLFTGEIALNSSTFSTAMRSWDTYFRITMKVTDTANVTAQITTKAHQIDRTNSQTTTYSMKDFDPAEFENHLKIIEEAPRFDRLAEYIANIKMQVYIKAHNVAELFRRPYSDGTVAASAPVHSKPMPLKPILSKSKKNTPAPLVYDAELQRDMKLLSTPEGRDVYFRFRTNNVLKNCPPPKVTAAPNSKQPAGKFEYSCKSCGMAHAKNETGPQNFGKTNMLGEMLGKALCPGEANAAAYVGKYDVVHTIRNWVVNGGYMFTMCYATETLDRVLACDASGNNIGYDLTFAFKDFDPAASSGSTAIDNGNLKVFGLNDMTGTTDKYKRPLAVIQNHKTSFPSYSGATDSFRKSFVKATTGPNNSPVNIYSEYDGTTVKYLGAEYGKGWFSFLAGHDPRLVETYRLILDNIMIGSLSSNNPPTASPISYGVIDWDVTDNGLEGDRTQFVNSVVYGGRPSMYGSITTTYPGDLTSQPVVDSVPYCFEDESNTYSHYRYTQDANTPSVSGATTRSYLNYADGSSRFVLVPIVSTYYTNGSTTMTRPVNQTNSPAFIYKINGRDRVRIKNYALFFLSDNVAHPDADPVLNSVGAMKFGEIRGKFVGYLK